MVDVFRVAAGSGAPGGVWITGTELLDAPGMARVAAACGSGRKWICTGGTHRLAGELAAAVAGAGAGLALVHQSRDPGSADRILCGSDNSGHVIEAYKSMVDSGVVVDLAVCGAPEAAFLELLRSLWSIAPGAFNPLVMVSMPWRSLDGGDGYIREIVEFCRASSGAGARVVLGVDSVSEEEEGSLAGLQQRLGDLPGVQWDLRMNVPVTPFENHLWSILNWSIMKNFRRPCAEVPGISLDSVQVAPFT